MVWYYMVLKIKKEPYNFTFNDMFPYILFIGNYTPLNVTDVTFETE